MALIYRGSADPFIYDGRAYHPGDRVPISKKLAMHMAAHSRLHRFEDADGDPVPEQPATLADTALDTAPASRKGGAP